ncbi:mannosyltransferase family protein [Conexibacter sp. W3-3-2]|uniref:mannosyltransferase family protein n=1 Tax=Conexibacter sp. W3-3-2 TaxID=2675227 RepID=UPI0018AB1F82|nr:mannosyltransferase family protein [Conexibacter sp. W3-3-2]
MGVEGTRASRRTALPAVRLDVAWAHALREALVAFAISRALVLVSGALAAELLGQSGRAPGFDPAGVTHPFGGLGDALVAPMARWDTVWFLAIADGGYGDDPARPAFFPLYPLLAKAVGAPLGSSLVGGILISWAAFLVALAVLHRLAMVELGDARAARYAVLACALFPTAFFHTAVYSEGLFLALSIGAVYAARQGAWAWAGALGALAAGTRSAGVLLVVPLALLHLRARREAGLPPLGRRPSEHRPLLAVALVPVGMLAFCGWFALTGGDVRAPVDAQQVWFREFAGPFVGLWDGTVAAVQGARQLLSGARDPVYFTAAGGDPFVVAQENLVLLAFLLACVPAIVGVLRRLPVAYGAYVVAALALPLSTPVAPQPLMSTPRFLAVLFPLYLWAGLRLARASARTATLALGASAILLCVLTARFATWHWVA